MHGLVLGDDLGERLRMGEPVVQHPGTDLPVLPLQVDHPDGPLHPLDQALLLHRLDAADDDDRDLRVLLQQLLQQGLAGHMGHVQVQQHQPDPVGGDQVHGQPAVGAAQDVGDAGQQREGHAQAAQPGFLVVDEQDRVGRIGGFCHGVRFLPWPAGS